MLLHCAIVTLPEEVKAVPGEKENQYFVEIIWSLLDKRQQLLEELFPFFNGYTYKGPWKKSKSHQYILKESTTVYSVAHWEEWGKMSSVMWETNLYVSDVCIPSEGNIFPKNTKRSESIHWGETLKPQQKPHKHQSLYLIFRGHQSIRSKKSKTCLFIDASHDTLLSSARAMTSKIL